MPSMTSYQCSTWLVEEEEFNNGASSSTEEAIFLIHIYSDLTPEDDSAIQQPSPPTIFKQFQVKRDYLLNHASSWQALVNMFEETNIPYNLHPLLMYHLMNCARENRNMDRKIVPIAVHIRAVEITTSDAVSQVAAFMDSLAFDSEDSRLVGDTNSAIETLEKVKIEDFSEQCVICKEDFAIGIEATRLPCWHTYHQTCIANWLRISNLCPLCRFQLPSL